jgi:hypothetical protein
VPAPRTLEPALERWLRSGNLETFGSWARLSKQRPKARERILAILCPVERFCASIPDRLIAREDLRDHPGHHVTANSELRAGAVNARSRGRSAVGAQRRGVDGAEHSFTIEHVMALGAHTVQRRHRVGSGRGLNLSRQIMPPRGPTHDTDRWA